METSLEMHQFYSFLRTQIPGRLSRCHQNIVQQLELYTPENSPGTYIKSVTKKSKTMYNHIHYKNNELFNNSILRWWNVTAIHFNRQQLTPDAIAADAGKEIAAYLMVRESTVVIRASDSIDTGHLV
jgi:hypothetical protein